ncbi:hypothetical protein ACFL4T_11935 [candidate division KSB1 bacterium]
MKKLAYIFALGILIFGIFIIQKRIDQNSTDYGKTEFYYVPNGSTLKTFSLGYSAFLADIFWIKGVLYFGRKVQRVDDFPFLIKSLLDEVTVLSDEEQKKLEKQKERYKYLDNFIEIVTDLDPYFKLPYIFGGMFLSMKQGEPDKAIEVLSKGLKVYPDEWRFYYIKGFNYFFYKADKRNALINFVKAAGIPGSTKYAEKMANMLVEDFSKKKLLKEFLEDYKTQDKRFEKEINKILEQLEQPGV